MYASRFNQDDFDDKKTAAIGHKLLASATTMKIHLHRDGDKVMMNYEIQGEFGEPETEDGFPDVDKPEAKATAGELLAAFLGRE